MTRAVCIRYSPKWGIFVQMMFLNRLKTPTIKTFHTGVSKGDIYLHRYDADWNSGATGKAVCEQYSLKRNIYVQLVKTQHTMATANFICYSKRDKAVSIRGGIHKTEVVRVPLRTPQVQSARAYRGNSVLVGAGPRCKSVDCPLVPTQSGRNYSRKYQPKKRRPKGPNDVKVWGIQDLKNHTTG